MDFSVGTKVQKINHERFKTIVFLPEELQFGKVAVMVPDSYGQASITRSTPADVRPHEPIPQRLSPRTR